MMWYLPGVAADIARRGGLTAAAASAVRLELAYSVGRGERASQTGMFQLERLLRVTGDEAEQCLVGCPILAKLWRRRGCCWPPSCGSCCTCSPTTGAISTRLSSIGWRRLRSRCGHGSAFRRRVGAALQAAGMEMLPTPDAAGNSPRATGARANLFVRRPPTVALGEPILSRSISSMADPAPSA